MHPSSPWTSATRLEIIQLPPEPTIGMDDLPPQEVSSGGGEEVAMALTRGSFKYIYTETLAALQLLLNGICGSLRGAVRGC